MENISPIKREVVTISKGKKFKINNPIVLICIGMIAAFGLYRGYLYSRVSVDHIGRAIGYYYVNLDLQEMLLKTDELSRPRKARELTVPEMRASLSYNIHQLDMCRNNSLDAIALLSTNP